MRLIDADELIQHIEKVYDGYNLYDVVEHWKDLVNKQPTVDQWHYPSRGEYPTENVLVLMKIPGCYVLGWYELGKWFQDVGKITELNCDVYHWQYIIPPKEEA